MSPLMMVSMTDFSPSCVMQVSATVSTLVMLGNSRSRQALAAADSTLTTQQQAFIQASGWSSRTLPALSVMALVTYILFVTFIKVKDIYVYLQVYILLIVRNICE